MIEHVEHVIRCGTQTPAVVWLGWAAARHIVKRRLGR